MLCSYYRADGWRTLSAREDPDSDQLVLVEHAGACPADPDGRLVALVGRVDRDAIADRAAAWRSRGWATAGQDRAAGTPRLADDRVSTVADPGDRTADRAAAYAVVEAAVTWAARPFCLLANPRSTNR